MSSATRRNARRPGVVGTVERRARGALVRARSLLGFDSDKTVFVTGAGRGGTTWIAELACQATGGALFFEPDHPRRSPAARAVGRSASIDARIELYRSLMRGRGANNWSVRDVRAFMSSDRLVLKSIVATEIVPELVDAAVVRSPVVVLRHPCAVAASRLRAEFTPAQVDRHLTPERIAQFPQLEAMRDLRSPCQRYALGWVMSYLPVAARADDRVFVARYEDFVADPDGETMRMLRHVGLETDGIDATTRPSLTDFTDDLRPGVAQLSKWQDRLTDRQVAEVLDVVRRCGIGIYTEDPMPADRALAVEL